jgi:glycosyltransferase involved in cell wall biosynthesis
MSWQRGSCAWEQASWLGKISKTDNVAVDEPARLLVRTPRAGLLDRFALRMQCRRWRRILSTHGNGPLIAYIYHPMFADYLDYLNADGIVYHAYDLYDHTPGWNDRLERNERLLLQRADQVIASSQAIADGLAKKVPRTVEVLPNGANFAAIAAAVSDGAPAPEDLRRIPRPRLGWIGSVHPEIDLALIADIAAVRPNWNFVLVGPTPDLNVPRAEEERVRCRSLPNVHFLGGKPVGQVPAYVAGMDVNLMCYRMSDDNWINAGYPLKLHEYLAAGRPVVSSDVPAVREFSHVVRIAAGKDDWIAAIETALNGADGATAAQRQSVAAANTWEQRVKTLDGWLSHLAGNRRRHGD